MENAEEKQEADSGGPGQLFKHFIVMEYLLEKLKVLNYDREFVRDLKMKSIHRHYFAIQTNPGEQFFLFTSLAAWLIRKCGISFDQPQEYDDPNSTITSILDAVRSFGVSIDFPPNKLKQGYGEHAIYVLDQLATEAMNKINFKWQRAEIKPEKDLEETEIEDDSELLLEKVEEEFTTVYSDDDDEGEETLLHLNDLSHLAVHKNMIENQKPEEIMESKTNTEDWLLELERVLPQLKVTIKADAHDWRTHLEQMQKHRNGIQENLTDTKTLLDKLYNEISATLDKISSREKSLNNHLEPLLSQYRSMQDDLARLNEQYKTVNVGVTDRTKTLSKISEELENIKKQMEERGTNMTDGTPLINIKKSIAKVKSEVQEMNIQIAVLENEILQSRLRNKTMMMMSL